MQQPGEMEQFLRYFCGNAADPEALTHLINRILTPREILVGGGSRDLVVAATLILTILIRPHGLFGRHDIERI